MIKDKYMTKIQFTPGVHPTYKEQFDKITTAYFNNDLNPYQNCACFIGNMFDNNGAWAGIRRGAAYKGESIVNNSEINNDGDSRKEALELMESIDNFYSAEEICLLENMFLLEIYRNITDNQSDCMSSIFKTHPNKEELLFNAMDKTLDLLRQIHESKGEVLSLPPQFIKRELITT